MERVAKLEARISEELPVGKARCDTVRVAVEIGGVEDGLIELFDLDDDVSEGLNIADRDPERTAALHASLVSWRDEVEGIIPEPNPDWIEPEVPNNAYD